jgi:hypothetical protein
MTAKYSMLITIQSISAFHAKRQNFDWPPTPADQEAALAKALDYQRAFYPVRDPLLPIEEATYNDAIALLALEMITAPPARAERVVKRLKEASSSGSSIETEYEASTSDPFPMITAMLAPLAPRAAPQNAAVRVSRMRP